MIKTPAHYPELADPQLRPRYTGIPTFFRTPFSQDLGDVDIGLIGVPFDGGVTNRTGARHGPREMRNQSSMIRKYNPATSVAPFDLARVRDLGDAWIERPYELEGALREITSFYEPVVAAGVTPLSVAATIRSRSRSCVHSPRTGRSAWSMLTRTATRATTIWARASIMAHLSDVRLRRG